VALDQTNETKESEHLNEGNHRSVQKQSVSVANRKGHGGLAHNCSSKNFSGADMNSVPSSESLGVYSTTGKRAFHASRKQAEFSLLGLCGILLLTCIALGVLFAMKVSKANKVGANSVATDKRCLYTSPTSPTNQASEPRVCNTAECLEVAARLSRNMNQSVNPCEDFFHFACDKWIEDNPIPPSENEYITFMKKIQANNEKLRNMLEDATGDYEDPIMKAKRYYRSCMNEDEVERTTRDQVLELIKGFGSWSLEGAPWTLLNWNWQTALLKIQRVFLHSSPLFTIDVSTNPWDSKKHIVKLNLPDLSLLREQYLVENDSKVVKKKNAYLEFMTTVAMLLGGQNITTTKLHVRRVLEFEKKLAQSMPSQAFVYENLYNSITINELQRRAPKFQWLDHLNRLFADHGISLNKSQNIIVSDPEYLQKMSEDVLATNASTLSDYFIWTVLRRLVPFLSRPFREAEAKFKKAASHIKQEPARWLTCIQAVNHHRGLAFATGSLYVKEAFDQRMVPLVTLSFWQYIPVLYTKHWIYSLEALFGFTSV